MNNTINGRMPQTIKKRVGCWNAFRQRKCPAAKDITFKEPGVCENCALRVPRYTIEQAMVDILEYAEHLERERDAAVEDLKAASEQQPYCETCIHANTDANEEPCVDCMAGYLANLWQWRGVQEVEK